MHIHTPADLGAAIRDRRKELSLDQATLAAKIGVNRKWVIGIERGRARAELGLVLRALDAVGLSIDIIAGSAPVAAHDGASDIDAIIAKAKKAMR